MLYVTCITMRRKVTQTLDMLRKVTPFTRHLYATRLSYDSAMKPATISHMHILTGSSMNKEVRYACL